MSSLCSAERLLYVVVLGSALVLSSFLFQLFYSHCGMFGLTSMSSCCVDGPMSANFVITFM